MRAGRNRVSRLCNQRCTESPPRAPFLDAGRKTQEGEPDRLPLWDALARSV